MKPLVTIALTGGGSGGHITPLLSLAHELKTLDPECQIIYIGHKGDRFDSLKESSKDFDFVSFIDGGKFRRYHGESLLAHLLDIKTLILNVRDFFKVIAAVGTSYKILRKSKPDVVFSKGGFVVVPVGIAAKLLRIPIVTHDSDTIPGLANRIVGRWAAINATGMPAKYYNYPKDKVRYVGVPMSSSNIRPVTITDLPKLKTKVNLPPKSLVLMVTGGGNGSKRLNDLTVAAAPHLLKAYHNLHIIHLTGQKHESVVKAAYTDALDINEQKRVVVMGFTPRFSDYAASADIIFSRAGATVIAEFAALAKACIIMPSPFLAGGHQLKNAQELQDKQAAVIVGEQTSDDELVAVLSELLNNPDRRKQLAQNISSMAKPNAAKDLAELILKVAKEYK